MRLKSAIGMVALLLLAGCQSSPTGPGPLALNSEAAALPVMERIAKAAQTCWFSSKASAFRPYHMANELNSFSGRPRILLVPARSPEARPLLVIHAEGNPAKVEAFGPLMGQPAGARIAADVKRWADGSSDCGGSA